jgi:hypothetical protein
MIVFEKRIFEPSREKVEKISRCGASSGRMRWATYNMHGEMRNIKPEGINILGDLEMQSSCTV